MKKFVFRTLGLTVIVLLSNLPVAKAAVGDCHVSCCNGDSWNGPVPPGYSNCCDLFRSLCGYWGEAYVETGGGIGIQYCLSYGSCEG
jgi:hypothetical protein